MIRQSRDSLDFGCVCVCVCRGWRIVVARRGFARRGRSVTDLLISVRAAFFCFSVRR